MVAIFILVAGLEGKEDCPICLSHTEVNSLILGSIELSFLLYVVGRVFVARKGFSGHEHKDHPHAS